MASGLLSSFCAFADNLLITFSLICIGQTHCGPPLVWLTFGHTPRNSNFFHAYSDKPWIELSSNLVSKLFYSHSTEFCQLIGKKFLCICRYTADRIELKLGVLTRNEPLQVWRTFGQASRNCYCFLATDLLSSFCTFADKPLIRFSSYLVNRLIMDLFWSN